MSGNYPPGVTGAEEAIAGPSREVSEQRTCEAGVLWVPSQKVDSYVRQVADILAAQRRGQMTMYRVDVLDQFARDLSGSVQLMECEWSGEVDVAYWSSTRTWTCPRCGHQHEEHPDD